MGVSGLVLANVLYLTAGVGVVALVGIAPTFRAFVSTLGIAYLAGIALAGIVGAELALINVPLSLPGLFVLAALAVALGAARVRHGRNHAPIRYAQGFRGGRTVAGTAVAHISLLLAVAASGFAVRPLVDWDAWAIWGLRARALYEFGGADNAVFFSSLYQTHNLDYPLFLPALEATGFRAMNQLDEALIHLQLLGIGLGFVGTLWALLRPRVSVEMVALSILAIVAAPPVIDLLGTAYADMPLAFFVSAGVVALARWIVDADDRLLAWAALFLCAASLTKNEGTMFAGAAFVVAVGVLLPRARARIPLVLLCGALTFVPLLPWRLFLRAHDVHNVSFDLANVTDVHYLGAHADRISPTFHTLLGAIGVMRFGFLVPLIVLALVAGALMREVALVAFVGGWLLLGFGALVTIYWISPQPLAWYLQTSASRTVVTLVVCAASLAPLVAAALWRQCASDLAALGDASATTNSRGGPLPLLGKRLSLGWPSHLRRARAADR